MAAKQSRQAAAGSPVAVPEVDVGEIHVVDDTAMDLVSSDDAPAPPVHVEPAGPKPALHPWPATVTVRNNTPIPVVEPITGIYLAPSGMTDSLVLVSEAHARAVLSNLRAIEGRCGIGSAILIEHLPIEM